MAGKLYTYLDRSLIGRALVLALTAQILVTLSLLRTSFSFIYHFINKRTTNVECAYEFWAMTDQQRSPAHGWCKFRYVGDR